MLLSTVYMSWFLCKNKYVLLLKWENPEHQKSKDVPRLKSLKLNAPKEFQLIASQASQRRTLGDSDTCTPARTPALSWSPRCSWEALALGSGPLGLTLPPPTTPHQAPGGGMARAGQSEHGLSLAPWGWAWPLAGR